MEQEKTIQVEKQQKVPAVVSIILFVLIWFFSLMILGGGASLFLGEVLRTETGYLFHFVEIGIMLCSTILAAVVMLKCVNKRPLTDLGFALRGRGKDLLCGLLVAGAIYLVGFVLSLLSGVVNVVGFQFSPKDLAISLVFFTLVAINEELMMRGYVLGCLLRTRMNRLLSLIISSVLFMALHLFNPNIAFVPLLNLALAGCLLGASYLYTRNLAFPISLHLFWNWIQGPVLGYEVSGINFCPTMLKLSLPEPSIWNGGAFGFEGSVICSVLCIIATVGIIWYFERRTVASEVAVPAE